MNFQFIIALLIGDMVGVVCTMFCFSRVTKTSQTFMKCCKSCPLYKNKERIDSLVQQNFDDVNE